MEDNENKEIENKEVETNINNTSATPTVVPTNEKGKGKIIVIVFVVTFLIALVVILLLVAKGFKKKVNDKISDTGKEIVDKQEEEPEAEPNDGEIDGNIFYKYGEKIDKKLNAKLYQDKGIYKLYKTDSLDVYLHYSDIMDEYEIIEDKGDFKKVKSLEKAEIFYPQFSYNTSSIKTLNKKITDKINEMLGYYYVYGGGDDACMCVKINDKYKCGAHLGMIDFVYDETSDYLLVEMTEGNYTDCAGGGTTATYYLISKKTKEVLSSSEIIKTLKYDAVGVMDFVNNQLIKKVNDTDELDEYRETVSYFIFGGKLYVTFYTAPMNDNYYFMYDGNNFVEYERTDSQIGFKKVANGVTLSYKQQSTENKQTKIATKLVKENNLYKLYETDKLDVYANVDGKFVKNQEFELNENSSLSSVAIVYPQFTYTTSSVKQLNEKIQKRVIELINSYYVYGGGSDGCICVKYGNDYKCGIHLGSFYTNIEETDDYILFEFSEMNYTHCASGSSTADYYMISKKTKEIMTRSEIFKMFNYDEEKVLAEFREAYGSLVSDSDYDWANGYPDDSDFFIYDGKLCFKRMWYTGTNDEYFIYDGTSVKNYSRVDDSTKIKLELNE